MSSRATPSRAFLTDQPITRPRHGLLFPQPTSRYRALPAPCHDHASSIPTFLAPLGPRSCRAPMPCQDQPDVLLPRRPPSRPRLAASGSGPTDLSAPASLRTPLAVAPLTRPDPTRLAQVLPGLDRAQRQPWPAHADKPVRLEYYSRPPATSLVRPIPAPSRAMPTCHSTFRSCPSMPIRRP